MKKRIAVLLILFSPLGHSANTACDFKQIVRTSKFWLTATLVKSLQIDSFPIIQKKWMVADDKFIEVTTNSVAISADGKKHWTSETIDLNGPIDFQMISSLPLQSTVCKILSKTSFSVGELPTYILFRASDSPNQLLPSTKGSFNHMKAPVAFTTADLGVHIPSFPLPEEAHPNNTPLRHDLSKIRPVHVSENFPRSLLSSVQSAIAEWNKALGKTFYFLVDSSSHLTPDQCLVSNDLCIFWRGPEDLSWADYGGITSFMYDPTVGYIKGGVIAVFNAQKQSPTQNVPETILEGLKDRKTGLYFAGKIWAEQTYRNYKNPDPIGSITALLIHEMGHDHGFRHYFAGSLHPSETSPSDTVMDYLPYPLFSQMQHLGDRDYAKIDALYRNGNFGSKLSPEMPCSDAEVLSNPLCNPQDVGNPAFYYSSIIHDLGPFIEITPMGGATGIFGSPQPVLNFAARYLLPNENITTLDKWFVENTLCQRPEKLEIIQHLSQLPNSVQLTCQGNF